MTTPANGEGSLSWPVIGTVDERYCGSHFASEIADALLRMNLEGFGDDDLDKYHRGFDDIFDENLDEWKKEYCKAPTYDSFVSVIEDALHIYDSMEEPEYNRPGERPSTYDALHSLVTATAQTYLRSFPGMDHKSKNTGLHGILRRIVNNNDRTMSIRVLGALNEEISYRMNSVMLAATIYKNYLGITMVDCHKYDTDNSSLRGSGKWVWCYNLLCVYPLFDDPAAGHYHDKGVEYLACCFASTDWSEEEITAKLDSLVKYYHKGTKGTGIPIVLGTSRIIYTINGLSLHRDGPIREMLQSISQNTSKGLRSFSPPLPEELMRDSEVPTLEMPGSWRISKQ